MNFCSDNVTGAAPEILEALARANAGTLPSYGEDALTARVEAKLRDIFETDLAAFPLATGTSANALALSVLAPPYGAVYCHRDAHVAVDECGAPEFYTGGAKLVDLPGEHGKLTAPQIAEVLAGAHKGVVHHVQPAAVSLTQATEAGTCYAAAEVAAIAAAARPYGVRLHMDGARFANAVASLGCAPKTITWKAGVDILSFGGTKNGLATGELVIFFDKKSSRDFQYRVKQAGHLGAKMRFLAAPWMGLLSGDVWLRNARHANEAARDLAQRLRKEAGMESLFPVESNAVFVQLSDQLVRGLHARGWRFFKFLEPDVYRLMCSWSTTADDISMLVGDFVAIK